MNYKRIKQNYVHKTAIIDWKNLIIGVNNFIGPYVTIGGNAQHPRKRNNGKIYIGNNNVFNEYVNIHRPTNKKKKTIIGNNNYIMNSTTIDHDCCLENNIVLSSNVILGGNVHIMEGAQLGIKTIVHQNQLIGSFSMLGMGSIVTKKKNIIPGYVFYGKPVKKIKLNNVGLKRNKLSRDKLKKETIRFKNLKIR
jgi:UDP-N-acetylglucosamine acyltransferase